MTLTEYLSSMGFLLVALTAIFRYLIHQIRSDRKFMEDRLTEVLANYNAILKDTHDATLRHAQAVTELTNWLKKKNGKGGT